MQYVCDCLLWLLFTNCKNIVCACYGEGGLIRRCGVDVVPRELLHELQLSLYGGLIVVVLSEVDDTRLRHHSRC